MRPIHSEDKLFDAVFTAKREAKAAFGKDEVYLEKLVERARHVEVQILGDTAGTIVHLFERDCSIQRRNQKVIERAPAPYLAEERAELCEAGMKIGRATDYVGAGTVEFLMDADTGKFYFIEVNPRIQVEHTVTEVVTDLDIVKAQIRILEGGRIGVATPDGGYETGIPAQPEIFMRGHALQCRLTTENPENNFIPDYGRITAYRGAMGFGIRIDGGTAYSGAVVTRWYDPLLEKVTAWALDPAGGDRPHGPGAARISYTRRRHQPALPRGGAVASEIPGERIHDALHRRDAGAVPVQQAPRPRHETPHLHRRRHRQRPSRGARPHEAAGRGAHARAAPFSAPRPSPAPSSGWTRSARRNSPNG